MPPPDTTEHAFAADYFENYARQVLVPAIATEAADAEPLEVAAFQTPRAVPLAEAMRARYAPVELGWDWGPPWSTCWFRVRGRVPKTLAGGPVHLRFSSDTEALLWKGGVPTQGFDVNRDLALILPRARAGEKVELFIEAACNHPFGAGPMVWRKDDSIRRWQGKKPGRLTNAELVRVDEAAWRLRWVFGFAAALLRELPDASTQGQRLNEALRRAVSMIDPHEPAAAAREAQRVLMDGLGESGAKSATLCHAVGHAHIDTAWLWPLRETRRKCLRTFSSVLRLMERFDDFVFLCSQAQQYAYVKEDAPGLYKQIAARVKEGRWEPGGAMWIESDCNCISGESMIRQCLHGTRWWREEFGAKATPQTFMYLPDTFGFPAGMPQILRLMGLSTFITDKIAWNQGTAFPHTTFRWRGIDGSEILSHHMPGRNYNGTNTPLELRRGVARHKQKGVPVVAASAKARESGEAGTGRWLQPYGFGDGGGGPTDWQILYSQVASGAEDLPRVKRTTVREFCEGLHRDWAGLRRRGGELPVWEGDQYLEIHRGTYTTQAWLKKANREAEDRLRLAEMLLVAAPGGSLVDRKTAATLDTAWKTVLLNQFHDILPGSSIGEVYEDAKKDHARVKEDVEELVERGVGAWAKSIAAGGMAKPVAVFNPGSTLRSGVVEVDGKLGFAANMRPLQMTGVDLADSAAGVQPVEMMVDAKQRVAVLANEHLRAAVDSLGRVTSIESLTRGESRGNVAAGPLGDMVLYEDRPRIWDAWDIDPEHTLRSEVQERPATKWAARSMGPLRSLVEIERPIGLKSWLTITVSLDAQAERLDMKYEVDWREDRRLLRAVFPTNVRGGRASHEIACGISERATHRNTPFDQARFEVPGHRWAAIESENRGLSVVNDCKYGWSFLDGTIGLSLLRSSAYPDANADRGRHEFRLALVPHDWSWRWTTRQAADALTRPFIARALPLAARRGVADSRAFTLSSGFSTSVMALKPADDGSGRVVLRFVESEGREDKVEVQWSNTLRPSRVSVVDGREEPMDKAGFRHDSKKRTTTFPVRPFEIVTLMLEV